MTATVSACPQYSDSRLREHDRRFYRLLEFHLCPQTQ